MGETCFDKGPQPPLRPLKPQILLDAVELPPGEEGNPAIEPAMRNYAEAYRSYLAALDEFPKAKAEWDKQHGSAPVLISVFSAGETIERDPARFTLRYPRA